MLFSITRHSDICSKATQYAMGAAGYTGIKILGPISITVGSRTATHQALVNEEQHFDVVLGRKWIEKMAVKCVYSFFS